MDAPTDAKLGPRLVADFQSASFRFTQQFAATVTTPVFFVVTAICWIPVDILMVSA